MKHPTLIVLLLFGSLSLVAQQEIPRQPPTARATTTPNILAEKKQSLATTEASLALLEKNVSKLKDEINKLSKPPQHWNFSMFSTATANYAQYDNWSTGGENAFSLIATHNMSATYLDTEKKIIWANKFVAFLGYQSQGSIFDTWRKTNDILNLSSKFSFHIAPKLSLIANFLLRTQFLATRNHTLKTQPIVSSFLSPGYINLGLGAGWDISKWLNIYLSPITIQSTIIANPAIDPVAFGIAPGESNRTEIGGYVELDAKWIITNSVSSTSRIILFSNYLANQPNQGIDVDWNIRIDAKLSKYFYAFLFVNLKYDADARILTKEAEVGNPAEYRNANLQSYQNFGIGFSYGLDKIF